MNQFNGFNSMPNNCGCSVDLMGGIDPCTQMKGTWISKKTGQEVIVRDCVMSDGNSMIVMLADGRMIDMNQFSSEYYQMSDEIYDSNGNVIGKCNEKTPVDVPEYHPNCDCPKPNNHDEYDFLNKPLPPVKPPHHPCKPFPPSFPPSCPPIKPPHHKPNNCGCNESNTVLVEKAHMRMVTDVFSKVSPEPSVECGSSLVIKNAPISQLQMLIDIFGVHIEDIAIYLYKNYYTPEKVISYLKKVLVETYKLKEPTPTVTDKDETNNLDPDYSTDENMNSDDTDNSFGG